MLSPNDTNQTTASFEHNERRQNNLQQMQTDSEPLSGRIAWRQFMQLREEDKRLRWELAEAAKDREVEQARHQKEIELYQTQLQHALASRDSIQGEHNELELRYQELYHAFQSAVEEEAIKIVDEAAHMIELIPENRPEQVNDVVKTVELRVRQVEDKHTAKSLYLMRQTQSKANRLEHELIQEREQIALERQNLYNLQQSVREQAEVRKAIVEQRLRAQYTLSIALITTVLLILLPLMQITLFTLLHIEVTQLSFIFLFAPLVICALLAALFAHMRVSTRMISTSTPRKKAEKGNP